MGVLDWLSHAIGGIKHGAQGPGGPTLSGLEPNSNIMSDLQRRLADVSKNGVDRSNSPVMTAPFNPMQNTSALMDHSRMNPYASGQYSGDQGARMGLSQQPNNPLSDIMSQITKLLNQGAPNIQFDPISMPKFDPTAYQGQATDIVNKQFDPVVANLRQQQTNTQHRAQGNQKAVGDMYSQLAAYMGQQGQDAGKQYDAAQAQSKQVYTDSRDQMAGMYAADAAAQRKEAQRLGTQAFGTNDAIMQQNSDKQFQAQQQAQQMQSEQAALEQQQQSAQTYDNQMAGAAKSQGAEGQQAIIQQLQDYMTQSDTNIAGVQSQAAGSINDLMMKLAEGTYQRDAQNAQFGYQQQRDYIGDQNNLYKNNLDAMMQQLQMAQTAQQQQMNGGLGANAKLNPWQQTGLFADQLDPGKGQDYVAAIQQAMSQRQELSGVNPVGADGQPIRMTPALFAQLIADSQASQGLDKNKEMMVAQQLYSMLYGK